MVAGPELSVAGEGAAAAGGVLLEDLGAGCLSGRGLSSGDGLCPCVDNEYAHCRHAHRRRPESGDFFLTAGVGVVLLPSDWRLIRRRHA